MVYNIIIMIKRRGLDGCKSTHVSHHAVLFQEVSQHFYMFGEWLMAGTVCCVVHRRTVTGLVGV